MCHLSKWNILNISSLSHRLQCRYASLLHSHLHCCQSQRGIYAPFKSNHRATLCRCLSGCSGSSQLDLSGIFPPIPTPFTAEENLDYEALGYNMKKWNEIPYRGYTVLGSNGEAAYLTEDEKVQLVKNVKSFAPKNRLIMAGSGCESTRDTVRLTKLMAEAGADVCLVITPSFFKGQMTASAMKQHYIRVADESPIPVILYTVPRMTGIDLSIDTIAYLSEHPNVIGMKDSLGDVSRIGHVIARTRDQQFQVLAGSAGFLLSALMLGCVGGVCGLANILGAKMCELHQLYKEGRLVEATQLQLDLIPPNTAVTSTYSVPGLKLAMDWLGYTGGPTRSPMVPLTESEQVNLREALTKYL